MKKIFYSLIATVVMASSLFVACSKDNDANSNTQTTKSITVCQFSFDNYWTKATVDSIADELASFHGREINSFLVDPQLVTLPYDISLNQILTRIQADISQSSLPASRPYLNGVPLGFNEVKRFCDYIVYRQGNLANYNFDRIVRSNFDLLLIENTISQLSSILYTSVVSSNTYDEFVINYNDEVEMLLANMTRNNYVPIKFASSVYLNSFETWCNYYYGTNETKEDKPWWKKVKDGIKKVWDTMEPYVEADADGAAYSALVGAGVGAATGAAVGGPAGAVAGAEAGAVGGAFQGAISGSWQYHNNNNNNNNNNGGGHH